MIVMMMWTNRDHDGDTNDPGVMVMMMMTEVV